MRHISILTTTACLLTAFVLSSCATEEPSVDIGEKLRVQVEEVLGATPNAPSTRAEVNVEISSKGEVVLGATRYIAEDDVIKLLTQKHIVICRDSAVGTFTMVTDDPWGAVKVCSALRSRTVSIF